LVDAQSVHPERFVLIADSVLRQGFVEAGRYLDELIIAQYSMMIVSRAPVVGQRVVAVKSAPSWKRPNIDAAIEKTLLPGVANKLSTAFPDVQESNAVIRKKGLMELSLPPLSGTEITVIGDQQLKGPQRSPRKTLPRTRPESRSGPRRARFPQSAPCNRTHMDNSCTARR
jgi:hypothetical protein